MRGAVREGRASRRFRAGPSGHLGVSLRVVFWPVANGSFSVTAPTTARVIQSDELAGRIRTVPETGTPARKASQGQPGSAYRQEHAR